MLYGAGSNWAQIGPAILNNGNRTDLIQCNNNGVAQDFEISTSSAGSSPTFKVEQYFGTVSVFKNGSDEWGCSSFTVTDAEFSGEIVEAHDQMIGDTANHDTFHNSKVKKHNDSTIYDGYSNGNGLGGHVATGDWFGRSRPNNYTMDVWDQDC
jgi:hypothetical protein